MTSEPVPSSHFKTLATSLFAATIAELEINCKSSPFGSGRILTHSSRLFFSFFATGLKNLKRYFVKNFGKFLKFLKFLKIKFYENFWLYGISKHVFAIET